MNYELFIVSSLLLGYYAYHNLNTIISKSIDIYVDIKHSICNRPALTLGPKPGPTIVPIRAFSNNGYNFYCYNNITIWTIWTTDKAEDRDIPDQSKPQCSLKIVNGPADLSITQGLIELAGPDGDFNNAIPTLDVLNAYTGKTWTTEIIVENENYEEIHIK